MTKKSSQGRPILGYTDTESVKLDLDDMPFQKVKELSVKTIERFSLEGFLILKLSGQILMRLVICWAKLNLGSLSMFKMKQAMSM